MKRRMLGALCAGMFLVSVMPAQAETKRTPDEASALVKKAVAFYKANGKAKALAEYNNPKGQFVDKDLYIFAIDMSGTTLANGVNPKLIGKNTLELKDASGKAFIKEFLELGKTKGSGWVDYMWNNPNSQKMEAKTSYVEKVDDIILGCGIYK
jgi:cytochrome c